MKIAIIINPKAGSVSSLKNLLKELEQLEPAFCFVTRKRGAAGKFAAQAIRQGCNYLIAAGGDGTLNEVVNGMARHARTVRLGLLPLGTGNDFARCLRLPQSVAENIKILRAAKTRRIDLVRVKSDRSRYFVNVSAGGFSGLVGEKLTAAVKKSWGPLAYLRGAAAALPELRSYHTSISVAGRKRETFDLYNVIVANGRYVAGGLPVAPKADPADGLLDVILIPKKSPAEMALLATRIVLGRHLRSKSVIFRRAAKVSIRSRPGMWFNVDGELVGNEPAVFEVVPRALQFVVEKR